MKKITKVDAEYLSDRFYDFYDEIWEIVKIMNNIKNEIEERGHDEISLNNFCIARHDKNIIVAVFYKRGNIDKIQFPLSYLYNQDWQVKYRDELIREKDEIIKLREEYNKKRDLDDIKRLKKLYPDQF